MVQQPSQPHDDSSPDDSIQGSSDQNSVTDGQFERLLHRVGPGAPLDEEELARIAAVAAEAFEHSGPCGAEDGPRALSGTAERLAAGSQTATGSETPAGSRRMRLATVVACLVLLAVGWLAFRDQTHVEPLALGEVLAGMQDRGGLQLEVRRHEDRSEVWVHQPGLVRIDEAASRYRIIRGSRLWEFDGSQRDPVSRRVTGVFDEHGRVDLLELLELHPDRAEALLSTRPSGRRDYNGHECYVYRQTIDVDGRPLRLEALVDESTFDLLLLTAHDEAETDSPLPVAELRVLAVNPEIDESRFQIPVALSEDGRIGKLLDAQGIVTLRADVSRRWTPVFRQLLIRPGDFLRTDARGPNAATVELLSGVRLTIGPRSLVELNGPNSVRLLAGVMQVARDEQVGSDFQLAGPKDAAVVVKAAGKVIYRVDAGTDQLVAVADTPPWLAGYESTSAGDGVGSLIVNVDGRNEPLTVGEHRVRVEIRDQIARTTIEETFVNHTDSRLEGIFHFPLPQDASISGFGMWIGGQLVEADVVEKQRARDIYETILRERRDPGLLEWTGGNIFKARVFPIEAHSEKRIKIVYTQVLPLQAGKFRYSYGLRSDLLTLNPVRELSIEATVSSEIPLASVESPTHTVRTEHTRHSARVQFEAQQYSPTRDFELVCELEDTASDVVLIPHQRGNDGYFLLQLTPPGRQGFWHRQLVSDSQPLSLTLLCDTSASMDSEMRRLQQEFVAAVLSSLGTRDRFNLAAIDVGTDWLFPSPQAADDNSRAAAAEFLALRPSLGWTDLDQALAAVRERSAEGTHVIYVGDGVVTIGQADPQAFVQRARQAYADKAVGTFHAVAVGSSYESGVLKGIASLGGGSMRFVTGERTPKVTAFELLNEIARPGLKNLKVQFHGIEVAAVYPKELPNIPAGTQQILVGRYLPTGGDQSGEVIVTGERNGEPVRYVARVDLSDAEQGNSFIPRLWARGHLEQLLSERATPLIQDEIIALSEEFHIITPFTSLLVLETDADRERFGVKRRFLMRDGERFFADGKAKANYELKQRQMRLAGDWRIGIRRQVLARLAALGRDIGDLQGNPDQPVTPRYYFGRAAGDGSGPGLGIDRGRAVATRLFSESVDSAPASTSWGFDVDARGLDPNVDFLGLGTAVREFRDPRTGLDDLPDGLTEFESRLSLEVLQKHVGFQDFESFEREEAGRSAPADFAGGAASSNGPSGGGGFGFVGVDESPGPGSMLAPNRPGGLFGGGRPASDWWTRLYPIVPAASRPEPADKEGEKSSWPAEALELSRSLDRRASLRQLTGGLLITRKYSGYDADWDRLVVNAHRAEHYSPASWWTLHESHQQQAVVEWNDGRQRGILHRGTGLGTAREAVEADRAFDVLRLGDYSLQPPHEVFVKSKVTVERAGDDRAMLVLAEDGSPAFTRMTIDTNRHVVLRIAVYDSSKQLNFVTEFHDFVEAVGSWWATRTVTRDTTDRVKSEAAQEFKVLTADEWSDRLGELERIRSGCHLVSLPLPTLAAALLAEQEGRAADPHRVTVLREAAARQDWDGAFERLQQFETLNQSKAGLFWVRTALEGTGRRQEDARQHLLSQTRRLVDGTLPVADRDRLWLAARLLNDAYPITDWNEFGALVAMLKSVFEGLTEEADRGFLVWQNRQLEVLQHLGRQPEWLELSRRMAETLPGSSRQQIAHAERLNTAGQPQAADEWLKSALDETRTWDPAERESLRQSYCNQLEQHGRWPEVLELTRLWMDDQPQARDVYERNLAALVMNDQMNEADQRVRRWLSEGDAVAELDAARMARLNAAIRYALGRSHRMHRSNTIRAEWMPLLFEAALRFARNPHHVPITSQILVDGRFSGSDEGDRIRAQLLALTQDDAGTIDPAMLQMSISLIGNDRLLEGEGNQQRIRQVSREEWSQLARQIRSRWDEEPDIEQKQQLRTALHQIYSRWLPEDRLAFLRVEIQDGPEQYRTSYRRELFEALLTEPWTAAAEQEAFELIPRLSDSDDDSVRLHSQVSSIMRFVDAMLARRQQADWQRLQDRGDADQLTRADQAARKSEFLQAAREGLAERLDQALASADQELTTLADWLRIERGWLDLQLNRGYEQVADECWRMLESMPRAGLADSDEELTVEEWRTKNLARVLQQRSLVTLMYLSARKNADPGLRTRLVEWMDGGIAADDEFLQQLRRDLPDEWIDRHVVSPWRNQKFELLIALDDVAQLERDLAEWIRTERWNVGWRLTLARVKAELGDLPRAIQLFESAAREQSLSPSDQQVLANWYLAVDRQAEYRLARRQRFEAMSESSLYGWLQSRRRTVGSSGQQTEVPEEIILALDVLLAKASDSARYLWLVNEFHQSSRDFRLLRMLPDAALGKTRQQAYATLNWIEQNALRELREEATADEVLKRVRELRDAVNGRLEAAASRDPAKGVESAGAADRLSTDRADLRILDLLETVVERKASEVLNQPGPHVDRALAALKRAFAHDWADGERRQMASFLRALHAISSNSLAAEQLRQLEALWVAPENSPKDRLHIARDLAAVRFHGYAQHREGLAVLQSAVATFAQRLDGAWPIELNEVLSEYSTMLQAAGRFREAEGMLESWLARAELQSQKQFLVSQLNHVHEQALIASSRTSLGEGGELYAGLIERLIGQLQAAPDGVQYSLVQQLIRVFNHARTSTIAETREDVLTFVHGQFPELIQPMSGSFFNMVTSLGHLIAGHAGHVQALKFVLDRYESLPPRIWQTHEHPWRQLGTALAYHRASGAAALEPAEAELFELLQGRLLPIVLGELRKDLSNRDARNRTIYAYHNTYFWAEKKPDFLKAVEEILAQWPDSPRRLLHIAEYLYGGLYEYDRAIDLMWATQERGLLDLSGRLRLVSMLHERQRFAESVRLLEPIVSEFPDAMEYRVLLLRALSRSLQPLQVDRLLEATLTHFHTDGRWQEGSVASLAEVCLEIARSEMAADLYEEALALRRRAAGGVLRRDDQAFNYYLQLATARAELRQTRQAVDAASAAIVLWPSTHAKRAEALSRLEYALSSARDLQAYLAEYDRETEQTGQDSPIIRKALGKVFQGRRDFESARQQFELAWQLQPGDRELPGFLLQCLQELGDDTAAVDVLLRQVDIDRHNLAAYVKLAQRSAGRPELAERAATAIVEVDPLEPANHIELAKFRESRGDWSAAIEHWRRASQLNRLEPTGLLGLANAQIRAGRIQAARETIRTLRRTSWDPRFREIHDQILRLESLVEEAAGS